MCQLVASTGCCGRCLLAAAEAVEVGNRLVTAAEKPARRRRSAAGPSLTLAGLRKDAE